MNKRDNFNQKLEEIGIEKIEEGLSIIGENNDEVLKFINENTNYNYILKKNFLHLSDSNFEDIKPTLLDEEIAQVISEKRKIVLTLSNKIQEDIEIYVSSDNIYERIIFLKLESFIKENLKDMVLTDRLTKALFKSNNNVSVLSSENVTAVISSDSDVYHGPSINDYAVVGSIDKGEDAVYILATSMGWYHIEYTVTSTGKHKTGYIPKSVVSSYSGGTIEEEEFDGGFCYATAELDVRTCDDFSLTAPVGTLYKYEGCTLLFSYNVNGNKIAFIEYSTSSGTKRGYVYSKYLNSPLTTIVCIVKEAVTVYAGPESDYASIGAVGAGEIVSLLAKESNWIYIEYNTVNGRKRGYITWDKVEPQNYTTGTYFPDFYTNGKDYYVIDEKVIVYGGPNSNYAQLGSVRNEDITSFNTNKTDTNTYTFEYTCIEYTVSSTGKRKRGYVLASKIVSGNLPEENNPIEPFDESYSYFGSKISYGTTQKGNDMFYYKFGTGINHLFLIFALHGWEDGCNDDGSDYHGDGNMLLKIAKRFMQDFKNLSDTVLETLQNKWSIYVFPGINKDGIIYGNSNNGFGRCLYNKLDPNRNWGGNFSVNNSPRYKTASTPFQAQELINLKSCLEKNIGSGKNVLLDIHGWFNQTVGNSNIAQYYWDSMRIPSSRHSYSYGSGYLIAWAKNSTSIAQSSSNYPGLGADTCLIELAPTTDYSDSNMRGYADNLFSGTVSLLNNVGESVGTVEIPDVNLPSSKKSSLKSEIVTYVNDNIDLVAIKAVRTREEAAEDTLTYDSTFTELSNKFKMRKSLIQTVAMWERACEGYEDSVADYAVENFFLYQEQVEDWLNLSIVEQAIVPYPDPILPMKDDSSTGFAQIFAETAIKARNWANDEGLISDKEYNFENWKDRKEIWENLKNDINYNLETCALTLLWGANEIGLGKVNPYEYSESEIKNILARYNGTGDEAEEYGTKNLGLYKIFESYNKEARE